MINLRFHIVSLVAVFLALALGLLVGSTLLDKATVESLRGRLQTLEERLDQRTSERDAARDSQEALQDGLAQFGSAALGPLVEGRLDDLPTLVVRPSGLPDEQVAAVESALVDAGAQSLGTLTVTADDAFEDGSLSIDDAVLTQLAAAVPTDLARDGQSTPPPDPAKDPLVTGSGSDLERFSTWFRSLLEVAGTPPGESLTAGESSATTTSEASNEPDGSADGTTTTTTSTTTIPDPNTIDRSAALGTALDLLVDSGLVAWAPPSDSEAARPLVAGEVRLVILSGPQAETTSGAVLDEVADTIVGAGPGRIVVGEIHPLDATPSPEDSPDRGDFVALVADDPAGRATVATDDEMESPYGLVVMVFCLEDTPEPVVGAFGVGPSASQRFPDASQ